MMQGDKRFREIVENCWDPEVRIKEMAEHKADMQVICTIPVMFSYDAKPADGLEISQAWYCLSWQVQRLPLWRRRWNTGTLCVPCPTSR